MKRSRGATEGRKLSGRKTGGERKSERFIDQDRLRSKRQRKERKKTKDRTHKEEMGKGNRQMGG